MKNLIYFFLIILTVFACKSRLEDPLNGFVINSSEDIWKGRIESLKENNILISTRRDDMFSGHLSINNDSIPIKIYFNYDGYNFGKLLEYRINLSNNPFSVWSIESNRKLEIYYPKLDSIMFVYHSYIDKYGKPSSTEYLAAITLPTIGPDGKWTIKESEPPKPKKENLISKIDGFKSIWKQKGHEIHFYCGRAIFGPDSIKRVPESYISYISTNYDKELKRLKDSLISTYTAKDYVECFMLKPEINKTTSYYNSYDRELKVYFDYIKRGANEDSRSVESFKYDVVFLDDYNTELFRIKGKNFIFDEPLTINKSFFYAFGGARNGWLSNYHSMYTPGLKDLDKAYLNGFNINCIVEVKAVKLDDGAVIE